MTNKKLYLIGDPVDHSLSPLLHGAMIAQTGVHYTYEVRRVQPRDLADFVAEAKAGGCAGFNVTMPHKEAILPLLDELEWSGNAKWHKRLMADVRAQAAIYPRFLQPRLSMSEALTAAEMQVLRLICADKSNAEIGEILNIRVSTVKSHVSSVLSKLGVNRRSEARTAAKKLWLISEDQ